MSIIVDALERVQSERENKHNHNITDESLDALESQDDALSPLEEKYSAPKYQPPKRKTLISKTNLILTLFIALLASFIFLLKQEIPNDEADEVNHLNPTIFEHSEALGMGKDNESLPTELDVKKHEDDFFNSIEKDLKKTLPINEETQPIETLIVEKIENNVRPDAKIKDEKTSIVTDLITPQTTPNSPAVPPKKIDIQQKQRPLNIKDIKTALPQAAIGATDASAPNWFMRGKTTFQKEGLLSASSIWTQGFSSLPPNTPVISIMINRVPHLATNLLNMLHNNQIDAFTVKGLFKKQLAYFTLALPPSNNASGAQNPIDRIGQLIDGKPFKNKQKFIQKNITQLIQISSPNKAKPQVKNITKRITNEARLVMAKEGIIKGQYREAIKTLRPVLFNAKNNWEVLFWIGSAKLGLGLYDEADDYFKKALAINPDIAQLWTQRAIIAQEKNDHISALKYLNRAQMINPTSPETLLNIAYSNDALGDRNGAIFAYRDFMSLTKNNPQFSQQRRGVNQRLHELGL